MRLIVLCEWFCVSQSSLNVFISWASCPSLMKQETMHRSLHPLVFEMVGIIISYSWLSQRKPNRSLCLGQALISIRLKNVITICQMQISFLFIFWSGRAHSSGPGSTVMGSGESATQGYFSIFSILFSFSDHSP